MRRPLLTLAFGAAVVFGLRMAVAWAAPDLVHPVDPAELKFAELLRGFHDGDTDVLRFTGAGQNLWHGATLPLSVLYAALATVFGDTYMTLKLMAALTSTAIWVVWVALAARLGGTLPAVLMGLLLALPPAWATQWWLTPWGSHPEAALLTAGWIWGLASGWRRALPLLVGVSVGVAPILLPTALVMLVLGYRQTGTASAWALMGWLPFALLAGPGALMGASLVEDPSMTVWGILAQATDPQVFVQTLTSHLPLPLGPDPQHPGAWDLILCAALIGAAWFLFRGRLDLPRRVVIAIVTLPLVHLCTLLVCSPRRPLLDHRYLLPFLPAVLLWPALAARAQPPARYAWMALTVLLASMTVPVLGRTLSATDLRVSGDYRPWDYLDAGLDRVPLDWAADVNAFLADRATQGAPTEGFAEVFVPRDGYPLLDGYRSLPAIRSTYRTHLRQAIRTRSDRPDAAEWVGRNAGWAIAIATGRDPAACARTLSALDTLRPFAWQGVAESLSEPPDERWHLHGMPR